MLSDSDPRIVTEDFIPNAALWLTYKDLAFRLLRAALNVGDIEAARSLKEQVAANHDAACDAVRTQIDDITMML